MEEVSDSDESIIDDDLVSFFDLLARFDYEDQKQLGLLPSDSIRDNTNETLD